jgi:hypothetical protein
MRAAGHDDGAGLAADAVPRSPGGDAYWAARQSPTVVASRPMTDR